MDGTQLSLRKRKVQDVIGAVNMKKYLHLMGSWFKGKLSKDEFDEQARLFFTDDTVRTHNEFLLAMLKRCQSVAHTLGVRDMNRLPSLTPQPAASPSTSTTAAVSMSKQSKPSVQRGSSGSAQPAVVKKKPYTKTNFTQRFQPANQLRQVQAIKSPPPPQNNAKFASSDHGLLPDAGMIEGRLFVSAWEAGLENVQNDIYTLIAHATEHILKDIVTHVVTSRRGYRISRTNQIKRHVGVDAPVCYLEGIYSNSQGSQHSTHDTQENSLLRAQRDEADSVQSLARSGHVTQSSQPITVQDTFVALQADPGVISSHVMYTLALERLCTRLHHPSQEEMSAKRNELAEALTNIARQRLLAAAHSSSSASQHGAQATLSRRSTAS